MPLACKYWSQGCQEKLTRDQLVVHEELECLYKPVMCTLLYCQKKTPQAKLLQHLNEDHDPDEILKAEGSDFVESLTVPEGADGEPVVNNIIAKPILLTLGGDRHFFFERFRDPNGFWCFVVFYLGTVGKA